MKLLLLSTLSLFLLFTMACNESTSTNENGDKTQDTIPEEQTLPAQEVPFSFEALLGKSDEGQVIAIKISENSSGEVQLFQEIEGLDLPFEEGNPACVVEFVDLNFDGLVDMKYPKAIGNANIYYAYWLYDKEQLQFVENTDMELSLPTIDTENKVIISQERGSAAEYTITYYEYVDGKVVKSKIEDKTYLDENTYNVKIQELQEDGSYKVTTKEGVAVTE
ncbi:MAG: hypothetical protein GY810_13775 [Aureispira sp.]|nr:hypothetical protein [Aureispira sp.]